MEATHVIIRPVITEQTLADAQKGKYTFHVARQATKPLIIKIVNDLYSVHVTGISVLITKGKTKRYGTRRIPMKHSGWKKAIVQVKSGEKIGIFEL